MEKSEKKKEEKSEKNDGADTDQSQRSTLEAPKLKKENKSVIVSPTHQKPSKNAVQGVPLSPQVSAPKEPGSASKAPSPKEKGGIIARSRNDDKFEKLK